MNDLPMITSRDNQRLINARKVRDRLAANRIFVEGKRLAIEALRSRVRIEECFVSERFFNNRENAEILVQLADAARFMFGLSDRVFQTIAATEHTQGVVLIAERPIHSVETIEANIRGGKTLPIVVALFQINNPSNLGAVLRTAEAAGVAGVIVTRNSADVFSPKSLRASMGAAFRLPVWNDVALETAIEWAAENGIVSTATGTGSSTVHTAADWRKPRLVIFGSEAHGLSEDHVAAVKERVRILMENGVESLNLAVATGVILFEAKRQNETV